MVGIIIGVVVVVLIVLLVLWFISVYNKLVKLRLNTENAFSSIDVELKKKINLISNLEATVKGSKAHESKIFLEFAKARGAFAAASQTGDVKGMQEADKMMGQASVKVMALSEQYPELKANESFMKLMNDLGPIEEKVAYARKFYNEAVNKYNKTILIFPSSIVANMFNFTRKEFYEADEEAKKDNYRVNFDE